WAAGQPNWMWTPAQYVWTPGGYVYTPGYWDYLPQARGCLFAPVYFARPVYLQPAFVYRPAVVINTGFFTSNLFVRPSYCHYYFGDYFAASYSNFGFRPWFSINIGIGGRGRYYDPFFNYYNWRNRGVNRNWLVQTQRRYDNLRRDAHRRPPRTYADLQRDVRRGDFSRDRDRNEWLAARSLDDIR